MIITLVGLSFFVNHIFLCGDSVKYSMILLLNSF